MAAVFTENAYIIETITVDMLILKEGLAKVDLLKSDVKG